MQFREDGDPSENTYMQGKRIRNICLANSDLYLFAFLQMMQNLLLEEGGLVQVESVNLQVATYSKFQPQSPDFLDITNPKAVYPSYQLWSRG